MKQIKTISLILLFAWLPFFALCQSKSDIDETYRDANSYFYFEDYEEALALYQKIYKSQPNNSNLNYRIGFCYLNIPGSKHKAIEYLEKATKNTTTRFNEESITEQRAPIDVYFYLGNAYLSSNRINDALKAYDTFYSLTRGKGNWDFDYFNHQVEVAKNTIKIQRNPVDFIMANLGEKINDRFPNFNAVISGNEKVLAFTTKLKFYNAINISRKNEKNEWEKPVNITLELQTDINCTTLCLSYDGNELYLFRDDNQDGNIYVTRYDGMKWLPVKKLNPNINTEAYETHAALSPDGKQLYFASNRAGGFGGLDIWVSTRTSGDNWGPARNLGPTINTPFNENTPFNSSDGTTLYFSSEGHNNMGGYDIFVSQLSGKGEWSQPVNLGYPLNTTDDDLFFHPINDGSTALISRFDADSYGETDIFEVELFIPRFRKSIVPTTIAQERTSDKTFSWLIVDTLSAKGMATIDPKHSNTKIDISINTQKKLFLNGKTYSIVTSAMAEATEEKKTNTEDVTGISAPQPTLLNQGLSATNTGFESAHNQKDSTPRTYWPSDSPTIKQKDLEISILNNADDAYLSEILLLLTPSERQKYIIPVLKRNWDFNSENFNENIVRFVSSFKSKDERNTIEYALSKLYDRIEEYSTPKRKTKDQKLLKNEHRSLVKAYNALINNSSKQLGNDLAQVMLKNNNINTLAQLISLYREQNPDGYTNNQDELLLQLTRMTVTQYLLLPKEQKLALYNDSSVGTSRKTSHLWLWALLGIALGGYLAYLIMKRFRK